MNNSLHLTVRFALRLICLLATLVSASTIFAQAVNLDRIIEAGGIPQRVVQVRGIPVDMQGTSGVTIELEAIAKLEIKNLVAICDLDREQAEKLQLAANADMARYAHDLAELQQMSAGQAQTLGLTEQQLKTMQALMQRTQRRDIFGKGSLLDKTISAMLSPSQKTIRQEVQAKKLDQQHHARVLQTVAGIERTILLRKDQRNWLIERLDRQELDGYPPSQEPFVGQLKLLKIPRSELATMFTAEEVEAILQPLERFQEFVR